MEEGCLRPLERLKRVLSLRQRAGLKAILNGLADVVAELAWVKVQLGGKMLVIAILPSARSDQVGLRRHQPHRWVVQSLFIPVLVGFDRAFASVFFFRTIKSFLRVVSCSSSGA